MPTANQMHVDALLTDFAKSYKNEAYVGTELFPIFGVKKLSDLYPVYSRAETMGVPKTLAGTRGRTNTVDWSVSNETYSCLPQGLNQPISKWEVDNSDAPYGNLRLRTTGYLQDQLLLSLESEIATKATATANYGANTVTLSGTNQWSYSGDDQTVNIIEDIDAACSALAMPANVMIIGKAVWDVMRRDAGILSLMPAERGVVTPQVIADLFDVERVIIAKSKSSTAAGVLSYMWGKHVIVAHVERPSPESVMLGATFAVGERHTVRSWTDPAIGGGSEVIEVNWAWDTKFIATDCGYLIYNAIA